MPLSTTLRIANGKITIELDMLYNNLNGSQIGDSGRQGSEAREFSTKIIDTGVGIEPERLRHLFKPYGELLCFGKLKLVKHHGIGLGLSNSKSFINFLGGSIRITKSEPGHTELQFSIPLNQERAGMNSLKVKKEDNDLFSPIIHIRRERVNSF